MEERIEFIEPVAVGVAGAPIAAASHLQGDNVWIGVGYWHIANLDPQSQARIEAEKKRALAHLEAQKIADRVDYGHGEGCFAIDEKGNKWRYHGGGNWLCEGVGTVHGAVLITVIGCTFYKPRPVVEKRVEFNGGGVPYEFVFKEGMWRYAEGDMPASTTDEYRLDAIWERDQRIAELEAQLGEKK